jgi:hypothetical protein
MGVHNLDIGAFKRGLGLRLSKGLDSDFEDPWKLKGDALYGHAEGPNTGKYLRLLGPVSRLLHWYGHTYVTKK